MDFQRLGLRAYYHKTLKTFTHNQYDTHTVYRIDLSADDQLEELLTLIDVPDWVVSLWRHVATEGYTTLIAVQHHPKPSDVPHTATEATQRPLCDDATHEEVTPMTSTSEDDFRPKPPIFEVHCALPDSDRPPKHSASLLREYISDFDATAKPKEDALQKFTERAGELHYRLCPLQIHQHQDTAHERPQSVPGQTVRSTVPPRVLTTLSLTLTAVNVNGQEVKMA